eukprot:scaffold4886_cov123-Isochrysis_galbana.AAC.14
MRREKGTNQQKVPGQGVEDLVHALFSELDMDGDGKVEFQELLRVSSAWLSEQANRRFTGAAYTEQTPTSPPSTGCQHV